MSDFPSPSHIGTLHSSSSTTPPPAPPPFYLSGLAPPPPSMPSSPNHSGISIYYGPMNVNLHRRANLRTRNLCMHAEEACAT
ncbi:hypothetical protein Fmac_007716 [Flemingia macrophylla]|uniref:Uncharacterized protein n=1 Tax=Flemingia macrophylla TaxID=520843 RepID=A0ABD1MVB9_9FABA